MLVLVVAGYAAGVMVTARLRDPEAVADRAVELAPVERQRPAAAPAATAAVAAPIAAGGSTPDFTQVAGQAVKGVANISSLQVVRGSNSPLASDPFFRYF